MDTAVKQVLYHAVTRWQEKQAARLIPFTKWCHDNGINGDRLSFHAYARGECEIAGDLEDDEWAFVWNLFREREDSRDLRDTQRDALR